MSNTVYNPMIEKCSNIKNAGKKDKNGMDYWDICYTAVNGDWAVKSNHLHPTQKTDAIYIFDGIKSGKCYDKSRWKDPNNYQTCMDLVGQNREMKKTSNNIKNILPAHPKSQKKYKKKIKNLKKDLKKINDEVNAPLTENGKKARMPAKHSTDGIVQHVQYDKGSGLKPESEAYQILYDNTYDEVQADKNVIQNHLVPEINYLKQTELTGMDFSFESLKQQNQLIQSQIETNTENHDTDNRKVFYQGEKISSLKYTNNLLFIAYYIFLIVLIIFWFVFNRSSLSIYLKLFIFIHLIFFPWLMDWTVQFIIVMWNYMAAYTNSNPFTYENYYIYNKNTYVKR